MQQVGEQSDQALIELLRRRPGMRVADLAALTEVTATAVRQRLTRLQQQGLIERAAEPSTGRGRPTYRYRLTEKGVRSAGDNYDQLATALWDEIRDIADPEIRRGLLRRIAGRLAENYREQIDGDTVQERMESLAAAMNERDIPFEVDRSQSLPVLTAVACPFPELAAQDRSICAMEKMLFAEVLGEGIRLNECRLDGGACCKFETAGPGAK